MAMIRRVSKQEASDLLAQAAKDASDGETAVIIKAKGTPPKSDDFVLCFIENLTSLWDSKLITSQAMRVMLEYIKYSKYKNVFSIERTFIMEQLGLKKQNFQKLYKQLTDNNLIIEYHGLKFINPYLFYRGSLLSIIELSKQVTINNSKSKNPEELQSYYFGQMLQDVDLSIKGLLADPLKDEKERIKKRAAEKARVLKEEQGEINFEELDAPQK